jgi:hypothetical protein
VSNCRFISLTALRTRSSSEGAAASRSPRFVPVICFIRSFRDQRSSRRFGLDALRPPLPCDSQNGTYTSFLAQRSTVLPQWAR